MLSLAVAALLAVQSPGNRPDLGWTIELLTEPFRMIRITVEADGAGRATTFQLQERWASARNLIDRVHGAAARSVDGEPLPVRRSGATSWTVDHEPGARIAFTHHLVVRPGPIGPQPAQHYQVLLTEDLFHMVGEVGLVVPDHLPRDTEVDLDFRWRGFAEAGWRTVTSFGVEPEGFRTTTTVGEFVHSLFIAGDLRVSERRIREQRVVVAIYGDWRFEDDELCDLTAEIVEMERDFFDDHTQPFYLVSALPVGTQRDTSIGGTGLTNSFALFMSPRYGLDPGSADAVRIKVLLAHELFHHWNGQLIAREQPERLVYWFSEGFTDYYARRLLWQNGLLTKAEYLDEVNRELAAYALNQKRDVPNAAIERGYWEDRDIKDVPYQRGHLVALMLDHHLRSQRDGSVDDIMRKVLAHAVLDDVAISTPRLLQLFEQHASDEFAQSLRALIVNGRMPEIPDDLLAPHATLRWERRPQFDLGFDYAAASGDNTIRGLRDDSAAAKAGLRNGMVITGRSIWFGDVTKPVTLTVRDRDGERRIRYFAKSTALLEVPVFTPR